MSAPIMKKSHFGNRIEDGVQGIFVPLVIFLLFYSFISPKVHILIQPFFNVVILCIVVYCFKTSKINKGRTGSIRMLIAFKYYTRKVVDRIYGIKN